MTDVVAVVEQVVAVVTVQGDRAPPALTVVQQIPSTTTLLEQGPAGRPGRDAGGAFQVQAGIDLGGHRAVRVGPDDLLTYASSSAPGEAACLIGITDGAADRGSLATVISSGPMDEPSWSWVPGQPVWLGANGALVQPQPAVGDLRQVAIAVTATRITVVLGSPIIRNT